jgi:polyvinyl alcohol dehydrogenase (cytochrome)
VLLRRTGGQTRAVGRTRRGSLVTGALALLALASGLAGCATNPSAHRRPPTTTGAPTSTGATEPSTTGAAVSTTSGAQAPGSTRSWLTYGGGFSRDSADTVDPAFTHAPSTAWASPALDGPVYGEPLVFRDQVLVATENDTVDALSATDGSLVWSDHLASPVPAGLLPCGDISPNVGITSTMVIDPASDTLFASAARLSGTLIRHTVYAIDLATHAVVWERDVDQLGWNAAAQLQRASLGLSAGHVIVSFGGNYGDCGSYNGWVIGVAESGSGPLLTYRVPTAREGAIWAPGGVTIDGSGDVFAVTGNGSAGVGQPFDHGDAVIELAPSLAELQYFAPADWAQDNETDADLGSTPAVLLGGGRLFIVGKQQTAYLLDAGRLGGIGGQLASLRLCNSRGANAYLAPDAYVVCTDQGTIDQVRVGPGDTLARGWTWTSPTGGAGSPTLAGGVLWSIDTGASVLYGIDPSTGGTRFTLPLDTGTPPHFAAPSAAGGVLVVAGSSRVEAFH